MDFEYVQHSRKTLQIHLFSILLLRVFILTILKIFFIIPKDVSSEVENCARDHFLFNSKTHVEVNSQGGLEDIVDQQESSRAIQSTKFIFVLEEGPDF